MQPAEFRAPRSSRSANFRDKKLCQIYTGSAAAELSQPASNMEFGEFGIRVVGRASSAWGRATGCAQRSLPRSRQPSRRTYTQVTAWRIAKAAQDVRLLDVQRPRKAGPPRCGEALRAPRRVCCPRRVARPFSVLNSGWRRAGEGEQTVAAAQKRGLRSLAGYCTRARHIARRDAAPRTQRAACGRR